MAPYVRRFIRSSLVWFSIGILLGLSMAIWPAGHIVYRPAHAHANLLGFVSLFIFGVAYHVLPRFVGRRLVGERWAIPHLWIQNRKHIWCAVVGGVSTCPYTWDGSRLTGTVRLKLYKGNAWVVGRKSPNSLYRMDYVTFEEDSVYNQYDAEGFIKLNALRLRLLGKRRG
mgnify:CR=1 FL=1